MKKIFFSWRMVLPLLLLTIVGCQKQQDLSPSNSSNTSKESIAGIIQNPQTSFTIPATITGNARASAGKQVKFTYLAAALAKTGLTSQLANLDGSYTLFAPTDDAFNAAGFKSIQDVVKAPKEVLTPILLYHVINAKILASGVPAGPNAAVKTLNGSAIYVTSNSKGVFINGTPVVLADVKAANGVIHVIDKILMPPSGNLVETAIGNPDFSFLVAAVVRASQGSTNVAALLSGEGPFTVFAPTNEAFKKLGFSNEAAIMAANPDDLTPILAYHVIGGRVFSSDLVDGMTASMLAGGTTTITLAGGARIKGNGNSSAANIIQTDIVSTNGVIHVIDQVLLP